MTINWLINGYLVRVEIYNGQSIYQRIIERENEERSSITEQQVEMCFHWKQGQWIIQVQNISCHSWSGTKSININQAKQLELVSWMLGSHKDPIYFCMN